MYKRQPIGCGKNFKGVYERESKNVITFKAEMGGAKDVYKRQAVCRGTLDLKCKGRIKYEINIKSEYVF